MPAGRVDGLHKVVSTVGGMKQKLTRDGEKSKFLVGYDAPYAIRQHEDLELNHPNGGQAKFLEEPMRRNRQKYLNEVKRVIRRGGTVRQGLLEAARMLEMDSHALVPIETGYLLMSSYIRIF